jgi:hypothetical protein
MKNRRVDRPASPLLYFVYGIEKLCYRFYERTEIVTNVLARELWWCLVVVNGG